MHNEQREKLRELIIEYGRSLCDDPRRCEALLKDYCGQYKREIFVLISALKNRVAEDLLKVSTGVPETIFLARLNKRLEDELAMTPEAAHWAVESWALALGFIAQPSPVVKPVLVPVSPSAPEPPPTVTPTLPSSATQPLIAGRYRDNGDGTVTDVQTGLQWMRFSLGEEWRDGTCTGEVKWYTWQEALDVADTLNRQGGYAGYREWQVPTKDQLQTLINLSHDPTIDRAAFPKTRLSAYWSSSTYARSPGYAWYVVFNNGKVDANLKTNRYLVRLVRGGP